MRCHSIGKTLALNSKCSSINPSYTVDVQKDFISMKTHLQQNHSRLVNLLHFRHGFTDLGGYHLQWAIPLNPAICVFPWSHLGC